MLRRALAGWTSLHRAALNGRLKAVQLLAEHGADIHLRTRRNESALEIAKTRGHLNVVAVLQKRTPLPPPQDRGWVGRGSETVMAMVVGSVVMNAQPGASPKRHERKSPKPLEEVQVSIVAWLCLFPNAPLFVLLFVPHRPFPSPPAALTPFSVLAAIRVGLGCAETDTQPRGPGAGAFLSRHGRHCTSASAASARCHHHRCGCPVAVAAPVALAAGR